MSATGRSDGHRRIKGVEFITVASGFQALEGPAADAEGGLYFADLRAGVYRLGPDGAVQVVVPSRLDVGGICLHASGGIVVAGPDLSHVRDGVTRQLLSLDDVASKPGTTAVGFNDIHADRRGRVFAGVMRRDRDGNRVPGELVWVQAEHEFSVVHDDVIPNGTALTADGRRLYHADTFRRRIVVFDVASDGTPAPVGFISTEEVEGLPDGLATDDEGCVWVAFYQGWCVARFRPDGGVDAVLEVPAHKPLSLCFGVADPTELYIVTARSDEQPGYTGTVLRTSVGVRGAPVGVASI